jgi:hypothetical protein
LLLTGEKKEIERKKEQESRKRQRGREKKKEGGRNFVFIFFHYCDKYLRETI